jgi:hypothetical protein
MPASKLEDCESPDDGQSRRPVTRFAGLSGPRAVAVLVSLVLAMALGVLSVGPKKRALGPPPARENDLNLYSAVVDRVRAGEPYYDAAGIELRMRGYGTRSVFNWRTPTYAWLIGGLPGPAWGQGLLATLALIAMATTFVAMSRAGGLPMASAGTFLLTCALHGCFLDASHGVYLSTELWSGTLILLSISMYALGRWRLGVAAGLLALFFRELALPYTLIALALSWRERRRGEILAWVVGLATYGLGFAVHAMNVIGRLNGADLADLADRAGWVQWGGVNFILETVSINSLLLQLPAWVTAVYLPLCLLGLCGWRGEMARRVGLAVGVYLAMFAVVGKPFNGYWGLMYSGLLSLGAVWSPVALRDLCFAVGPLPSPIGFLRHGLASFFSPAER